MSHLKERKEKICLNCKADLHGLYCHVCGQANTEPKESAWHLVTHFFYDITHFDGKFFTTLQDLLAKPGFLSREYMLGKRASYLNPVRMYVFTSAFFFIIFFSIFNVDKLQLNRVGAAKADSLLNLKSLKQQALSGSDNKEDSQVINQAFRNVPDSFSLSHDSTGKAPSKIHTNLIFLSSPYRTLGEYDSAQKELPPAKRNGWFMRAVNRRAIELTIKYEKNKSGFFKEWLNVFVHEFPKMFFISLPIFALLLRLLYVRRKQYYYVDHGIFAIHLYIFYFILMLFWFGLRELRIALDWNWINMLNVPIILFSQYYFYRAMYIFYKQGWIKTFLKYFLLNLLSFFVLLFLTIFFFLFSAFEM